MQRLSEQPRKHLKRGLIVTAVVFVAVLGVMLPAYLLRHETGPEYYDETKSYSVTEDIRVEALTDPVPYESPAGLEEIGGISSKQALVVGGQQSLLYATFDDKEAVFVHLENETAALLTRLQEQYDLQPVGEHNLEAYSDYAQIDRTVREEETGPIRFLDEQTAVLESTWAVWKNHQRNAELIDYLTNARSVNLKKLYEMMPEDSPFSIAYREENDSFIDKWLRGEE